MKSGTPKDGQCIPHSQAYIVWLKSVNLRTWEVHVGVFPVWGQPLLQSEYSPKDSEHTKRNVFIELHLENIPRKDHHSSKK